MGRCGQGPDVAGYGLETVPTHQLELNLPLGGSSAGA